LKRGGALVSNNQPNNHQNSQPTDNQTSHPTAIESPFNRHQ
jgi:hypothetical protein